MSWRWTKAIDVPKSWEGKQAWRWNEYDEYKPFLDYVPINFSRVERHCGGIWFKLMEIPKPPDHT